MKFRQGSSARRPATIAVLLALCLPIMASQAQNFTTSVQENSTQSWNQAIWEPGPVSPTAGNSYEVLVGGIIQTPSSGSIHEFWGDSLTLDSDSLLKVAGVTDVVLSFPSVNGQPGLVLNGGRLHTEQETDDQVFTIDGDVSVTAPSFIRNVSGLGGIVVTAQLTGNGGLALTTVSLLYPLDIQSTNNSYSGSWQVSRGYLKGSGVGSLGTGDITVSSGSVFEVCYDIQTPGALELQGSDSVMILHQNCQFSAVAIDGVALAPGTYTFNNLLAQFPGNFAPGGSGSITVVPAPSVLASPPPPPASPGYYVDYAGGSDSNAGTNPASAWQHCPGDPAATGAAGSTPLNPGDTVFFKGGVQYVLTGNGNPVYQTGIGLNWNGAAGQPITYDGNSAGTWGTGRAILTDNYSTKYIAAFYNDGAVNNLAFNNLEIGPIGGSASLPPDPGTGVPSNQGYGIFAYGTMNNVTIQNCYFHDLGYWFNQQPMDGNSLGGSDNRISGGGVIFFGASSVVITNCEFTKQHTAIEFAYSVTSSNLTIASCLFHDYIVWGIDLA
ncbi:MAG: right-handed parallel beta-helix repeat-containing protein, partial [Verrucomicrobiia bacterium]